MSLNETRAVFDNMSNDGMPAVQIWTRFEGTHGGVQTITTPSRMYVVVYDGRVGDGFIGSKFIIALSY